MLPWQGAHATLTRFENTFGMTKTALAVASIGNQQKTGKKGGFDEKNASNPQKL